MKKIITAAVASVISILFITNCNFAQENKSNEIDSHEHSNIKVVETNFAPDYKTFSVKIKVPDNISFYSFTDSSQIHIETSEETATSYYNDQDMQPTLTHVKNIRQQELADNKLCLLLLVDLTLPEEDIINEKRAILQMRKWFADQNLHIAFMRDKGVTATMPISDYVIENYFKKSNSKKLLYRSILEKMEEINTWNQLRREQKGLIVFSNGDVYERNIPLDPKHYELQERLLKTNSGNGYSSVEYINVGSIYQDGEGNEAKAIMEQLTAHTQGLYLDKFNWSKLLADILETYKIDYADYQLDFTNPNNKVYVGKKTHLKIQVYDNDKLIGTGCAEYLIGSIYDPVIINGQSTTQVILQGILITILIWVFAYFILQLAIPYFKYKEFKRKYVTHYTNQSMVFNGIKVSQSCYLCKAPFLEGDDIVVKCKHVLHKSCWDENGYKCPEYGRHCKNGSHYYNDNNLFDRCNAPFYTPWIMIAILAGLLSWIFFLEISRNSSDTILHHILLSIHDLKAGTPEAQEAYDNYGKHLYMMPPFGFCLNLFSTFCFSFMSELGLPVNLRIKWATCKAFISGFLGYATFLGVCIISIIFDLEEYSIFIDWLPWVANGFIIAGIATYNTRIMPKKMLIGIGSLIRIITMYASINILLFSKMDDRKLLLICFIIYPIAMAVSIAISAPKSEHYFLHVEGAIKPMDIALYKWIRTSPNYEVTIGKSVDNNLQMSWDLDRNIAPRQATIIQEHGNLYLKAVEKGVKVNEKELNIDEKIPLYHGKKFVIGKTTFTYIEKDK